MAGQRLLQTASDIFLGWTGDGAAHYYVRQLWDMKGSMQLETMSDYAEFLRAGEGLAAPGPGRSGGTNQRKGAEG